jgi:nitrite reductase/ring-hydroxylating ferredoxin subunit
MGSKIKHFFISLVFAPLLITCENNKNDVIPDQYIDFTMDISGDILFAGLAAIGNSVIVTSQTNNWGNRAAGFDYNGIIVYRAQIDYQPDFYAYDRTCPHDYVTNELSVKVNIDFTQAICPKCSTYYELSVGGISSSGPGKYPLKNYKTSFDGRYLKVWNY